MDEKDWKPAEMPPIGNPPDFEQRDKEVSEEMRALDYIPTSEFPGATQAVEDVVQMINTMRRSYGVPALSVRSEDVRFIDASVWKQCPTVVWSTENFLGFYDTLTGICYIALDVEACQNSRLQRMNTIYTLFHELGHKCFPALPFHLSEGLADFIARETMRQSAVLTEEDRTMPSKLIKIKQEQGTYIEIDGFRLLPEDLFAISEQGVINFIAYSRTPQMHLIRKLQSSNPEAFKKIVTLAFTGGKDRIDQIIIETWGEDVAEYLRDEKTIVHLLIDLIDERNRLGQFLDK